MVSFKEKGDFKKTEKRLKKLENVQAIIWNVMNKYGVPGNYALANATPEDSGETASSWRYTAEHLANGIAIYFSNDNVNDGANIAILLQYGHGTRNGGYVQGRDYINPAIRPIFDQIAEEIWREVDKL